jgi:hypothetical protein
MLPKTALTSQLEGWMEGSRDPCLLPESVWGEALSTMIIVGPQVAGEFQKLRRAWEASVVLCEDVASNIRQISSIATECDASSRPRALLNE